MSSRPPSRFRARLALMAALACASCVSEAPRWEDRLVLTQERVDALLGMNPTGFDRDLLPQEIPVSRASSSAT